MLRKGIAFLVLGALCASTAAAADGKATRKQSAHTGGLIGWLKQKSARSANQRPNAVPSPIQRAVVDDAEKQAAHILQTAQKPEPQDASDATDDGFVEYAQPLPIEMAPVVPNNSSVSGPQYFSATAANGIPNAIPVTPGANWQQYAPPLPVHRASGGQFRQISSSVPGHLMRGPATNQQQPNGVPPVSGTVGQYPQTGAALYPAPVPGIPANIGGTAIVHPAFQPHEMLYAHSYKAMYPPYYYKVNGGWWVSPFGVWSRENWKLQGTTVKVKYNSRISPFALFKPPASR
jgi:hypothetical protein